MQRNWIGRSEGARVRFPVVGGSRDRNLHDAHRHDLRRDVRVARAGAFDGGSLRGESPDPAVFREHVGRFRALDREARLTGAIDKEGFDTGRKAINPFTKAEVPDLDCQLRPRRPRHGSHHGRAGSRSARFRVRLGYGLPIKVVVVEPGRDTPVSATMPEASTNYGRLVDSAEHWGRKRRPSWRE